MRNDTLDRESNGAQQKPSALVKPLNSKLFCYGNVRCVTWLLEHAWIGISVSACAAMV